MAEVVYAFELCSLRVSKMDRTRLHVLAMVLFYWELCSCVMRVENAQDLKF